NDRVDLKTADNCPKNYPPRIAENQRRSEVFLERAIRVFDSRITNDQLAKLSRMLTLSSSAGTFYKGEIVACRTIITPLPRQPSIQDDELFFTLILVRQDELFDPEMPDWVHSALLTKGTVFWEE